MVKIIWILLSIDAVIFVGMLLMTLLYNSDAAGNAMASGLTAFTALPLIIAAVILYFSQHPVSIFVSGFISVIPILIAVYLLSLNFTSGNAPQQSMAEQSFSSKKQIALAEAIEKADTDLIRKLVAEGADVNAIEKQDITPIKFALNLLDIHNKTPIRKSIGVLIELGANPTTNFPEAVRKTKLETIQLFLEAGADPNTKDYKGTPVLFKAIMEGQPGVMRALIKKGANANAVDEFGRSALLWAANIARWEEMLYLLENGATFQPNTPAGTDIIAILTENYKNYGTNSNSLPKDFLAVYEWMQKHGVTITA